MPVVTIRIEQMLWDAASARRREDWRISITGLTEEARLGDEDDHLLVVSQGEATVALATFDAEGTPRALHEVAHSGVRRHVDEYLAVIARMQNENVNALSTHVHALDMAKKVVHDAAARALARQLPTLARDHESYRRLFTLLLSVVVDVTELPGAIAHRRHA